MPSNDWTSAKWRIGPDEFTIYRQTWDPSIWSAGCDHKGCRWYGPSYGSVSAAKRAASRHSQREHVQAESDASRTPQHPSYLTIEITEDLCDAVRTIRAAREDQDGCTDTGIAELELEDAIIWAAEFGGGMADQIEDHDPDHDQLSDSLSDSDRQPAASAARESGGTA